MKKITGTILSFFLSSPLMASNLEIAQHILSDKETMEVVIYKAGASNFKSIEVNSSGNEFQATVSFRSGDLTCEVIVKGKDAKVNSIFDGSCRD